MGTIFYGGESSQVQIEDRALAHLKLAISTKLRRNESFTLSWQHPEDQPRGRSTIWLHPSISLRFVFDDPSPTEIDRRWLEQLMASASTSGGIQLRPEDLLAAALVAAVVPVARKREPARAMTGSVAV